MKPTYQFHSDPSRRPKNPHPDSPQEPEPYIADPPLIQAVNLAIHLRRPLLLEGEAGCGKTRLAPAVAYELGLPLYRWNIHSTTKAKEGQYEYDAILRLHDVQAKQIDPKLKRDPSDPRCYRRWGALGQAFQLQDRPAIVLIDEIDKADLDFPNDLLTVLDRPWKFDIPETGETIAAHPDHRPIVIITSNKEKANLPAPFLRRCLYYYIQFPDQADRLQAIVNAHYAKTQTQATKPQPSLITAAIDRFLSLRNDQNLFKKPGTSEFLDWLQALQSFTPQPYPAAQLQETPTLPYPELLFKLRADWQRYTPANP